MKRARIRPIILAALTAVAALFVAICAVRETGHQPAPSETGMRQTLPFQTVVFITIDTLRADHLQSYGYFRATAPFIDGLAAEGVKFLNAISASSHTAPSHVSMFTSLYPFQHGVLKNGDTLGTGTFHMRSLFESLGFTVKGFPAVRFMEGMVGFERSEGAGLAHFASGEPLITAERMVTRAVNWLEAHEKSQPVFLWLHLYDVHQWQLWGRIPKFEREQMAQTSDQEVIQFLVNTHATPRDFFPSDRKFARSIHGYDAQIRFVDSQLKRLYERVSDLGRAQTSLWIITPDHGEGLGNHRYEGHGEHLYQEQLRVPLIMFGPGIVKGREVPDLVRSIDILPTLVEMFRVNSAQINSALHGDSFAAALIDPAFIAGSLGARLALSQRRPKDQSRSRRSWRDGDVFSIQDGSSKYIHFMLGGGELYNLIEDKFELRNLLGSHMPDESRLLSALEDVLKSPVVVNEREGATPTLAPELLKDLETLGYM